MYSLYEYNQAGHMKVVKDEGIQKGIESSTALFVWLTKNNRQEDILRAGEDSEYLEKLFEEHSKETTNKN